MSTDATRDPAPSPRTDATADAESLDGTVVHYEHGPDRYTAAPTDVAEERRLTAWLSVDADAVVTLREMR